MSRPLSRRNVIGHTAVLAGGGVFASLGLGPAVAQGAKVAPNIAQYQPTPRGKAACAGCASFVAPAACKMVSGAISPSGWCILFAAKS